MARDARHITLDGEQYVLYRAPGNPANLNGQSQSATPAGGGPGAEAVRLFEDYSLGMGFGRRLVNSGYSRASKACTRYPDMVFGGPKVTERFRSSAVGGAPVSSTEIDWRTGHTDIIILAGHNALIIGDGQEDPALHKYFSSSFSARSIVRHAGGPAFAAGSGTGSDGYLWRLGTDGWTQSTQVARRDVTQVYWVIGGGIAGSTGQGGVGDYRMIGTDATYAGFYWITATPLGPDPLLTSAWGPTAPVIVGNGAYPIKAIVSTGRKVFFVKVDGIHGVDSTGYAPNLTPGLAQHIDHVWNGIASCHWNGYVYASYAGLLYRYPASGTTPEFDLQPCGPGEPPHPNESDIWGYPTALCPVGSWLLCFKYNVDKNVSYGCYGRERGTGEDGYGPIIWHGAEIEVPGMVTWIHPTGLPSILDANAAPILWFGGIDGTETFIHSAKLPRGGNPLKDPLSEYERSWYIDTGKDDGGSQNSWTKKAPRQIDIYADNVGANGVRVTVSTSTDGGDFVREGIAAKTPHQTFGTNEEVGTMIELRIAGSSKSDSVTPIIRSVGLHEILIPKQNTRRGYQLMLEPVGSWETQAPEREAPWVRYQRVSALQEREDIEMIDEMGRRCRVKVLPGTISYQEKPDPNGSENFVFIANIQIDEIAEKWRQGDGTKFDDATMTWS